MEGVLRGSKLDEMRVDRLLENLNNFGYSPPNGECSISIDQLDL